MQSSPFFVAEGLCVFCSLPRQVARDLENSRQRAEEELMATARIVTSLEGRLRSSNLEAEQSRGAVEVR